MRQASQNLWPRATVNKPLPIAGAELRSAYTPQLPSAISNTMQSHCASAPGINSRVSSVHDEKPRQRCAEAEQVPMKNVADLDAAGGLHIRIENRDSVAHNWRRRDARASERRKVQFASGRCKAAWWRSWSSKPAWGSTKFQVGSIPIHLRQSAICAISITGVSTCSRQEAWYNTFKRVYRCLLVFSGENYSHVREHCESGLFL